MRGQVIEGHPICGHAVVVSGNLGVGDTGQ